MKKNSSFQKTDEKGNSKEECKENAKGLHK